jgi:hypothetical protein
MLPHHPKRKKDPKGVPQKRKEKKKMIQERDCIPA